MNNSQIRYYFKKLCIALMILGFLCLQVYVLAYSGTRRTIGNHFGSTTNCQMQRTTSGVVLNRACIIQDKLPKLGVKDTLDKIRPYIVSIANPYNATDKKFIFTGSILQLSGIVDYAVYKQQITNNIGLSSLYTIVGRKTFFIPWETIAARELRNYKISASDRDISQYGNCAKTNFVIGMDVLGSGVVLWSGTARNANTNFSNLSGYCTGASEQVYKFYQGICGVTSMIFRAGMLQPDLQIVKRHGHTSWYTKYYGETVVGDDAAIYEDIKQFEIQNISPETMILRSKRIGDKPYVLLVSERAWTGQVLIQKKLVDELSAEIIRSWHGTTKRRYSVYDRKTDSGN